MTTSTRRAEYHVRLSLEHGAMVDDLRRLEKDLPARGVMVRRLIEAAHKSKIKPAKPA
jgi:hypothetical protein